MKIETIKVAPALAEKWLATNATNNRKLSKKLVNQYALDMINGNWQSTGEAIKFDRTGKLIDGQHRLSAVVASKKSVYMTVITDLDESVIQVIDTGKSRTAGDALTIAGSGANANAIAALARKIIGFQAGEHDVLKSKKIKAEGKAVTNRDILAFCADRDLSAHVAFAARIAYHQVTKIFSAGEWAFMHWLFSQKNQAEAESFLTKLATLDNLKAGHPVRLLFDKLTRSTFSLNSQQRLMATITVWNAIRTGQALSVIRVARQDDAMPIAV